MEGPPMKFHIDPNATPVSRKKPLPAPIHWQEQVEKELLRDINLGILESVPHGQSTDWCFPMVITRKNNGNPRRKIDLLPLNRFCKCEAHHTLQSLLCIWLVLSQIPHLKLFLTLGMVFTWWNCVRRTTITPCSEPLFA